MLFPYFTQKVKSVKKSARKSTQDTKRAAFRQLLLLFVVGVSGSGCGSRQLFAEQVAEDQTGQRTGEQQLPDQRHGHIAAPGLHPGAKAGLFEQQGGDQAHGGAHQADDHCRDGIGDELGPVGGPHDGEGQLGGQIFHNKELQNDGDGHHDGHFVQGHGEGGVGHAAGVQRHVVDDHAVDHDDGHDDGVDDVLEFGLGYTILFSFIKTAFLPAHKKREAADNLLSAASLQTTTSNW